MRSSGIPSRACDVELSRVLAAIRGIRIRPAVSERVVADAIADELRACGIVFERECTLGPRARIDFMCPIDRLRCGVPKWAGPGIGIEAKKGKPSSTDVARQIERYCRFAQVLAIVIVVERNVFQPPRELFGKQVRCIALSRNWGIAL